MDFGKVEYIVVEADNGNGDKKLKLTLIGQGDEDTLMRDGLAGLRRKRLLRLAKEAGSQGFMLSYEELSRILLTSLATLKRDVLFIEKKGGTLPIRGRRKNGNSIGKGFNPDGEPAG